MRTGQNCRKLPRRSSVIPHPVLGDVFEGAMPSESLETIPRFRRYRSTRSQSASPLLPSPRSSPAPAATDGRADNHRVGENAGLSIARSSAAGDLKHLLSLRLIAAALAKPPSCWHDNNRASADQFARSKIAWADDLSTSCSKVTILQILARGPVLSTLPAESSHRNARQAPAPLEACDTP